MKHQKGAATLGVSVILILLISIGVFSAHKAVLNDSKATQNTYWHKKASQAAEGGMSYALSWMSIPTNTMIWIPDTSRAPNTHKAAPVTKEVDAYAVTVNLYKRTVNDLDIVEMVAESVGTDNSRVEISQSVYVPKLLANGFDNTPLVINGCLSGVTGNPSITPLQPGSKAISSSNQGSCLDTGHFDLNGGTVNGGDFNTSGWDHTFGMTPTEMKNYAQTQRNKQDNANGTGVFYYDASNPAPANWHDSVGSANKPAVVVFNSGGGCPKINGSPTIYGVVYYAPECADNQGWGGAKIHGSVVVDGSITKLTANSDFTATGWDNDDYNIIAAPIKVLGTWRDFK